jgi:nicotinate-nucleotide--dimethylbenzimidazole phosphoribosyltransferase
MGIANTTSASALTAAYTNSSPAEVTGRGTGIDDAAYERKIAVLGKALALHRTDPEDPLGTLATLGGFEIAGLAGVVLGAAAVKVPVVLDGFITSAAALAAVKLAKEVAGYLIASHRSVEKGHRAILQALGLESLFDLQLRIVHEMASFESAGVIDTGA